MVKNPAGTVSRPELSLRGLILGAVITVVFTAANIYLGLKVGLTFASSIPAAVISMAVLRLVRNSNILENNIVQTVASAAGTLASIIFVLPGLVMVGYWKGFPFWETAGICAVGGALGVMFTVPLRRAMVVESDLPYPEGVAAAEILRVGSPHEEEGTDPEGAERAGQPGFRDVAFGAGLSGLFAVISTGFGVFATELYGWFRIGSAATGVGMATSLALVGAGYLCGIVVGMAMLVGVIIAWGGAIPILEWLHPQAVDDVAAYATGIWRSQVRFIGAGVLGVAAIWTLIQLLGPMIEGVRAAMRALRAVRAGRGADIPLVERDLPFDYVAWTSVALMLPLAGLFAYFLIPTGVFSLPMAVLLIIAGTLFAFAIGFVVATACGYMAGLIGSSNSPISGIGLIAIVAGGLLMTGLLGGAHGLLSDAAVQKQAIAFVLFVGGAVLAIATISNDNLQDLKTGQLVGATPWRQQVALVFGSIVGALVIPPVLDLVYQAYGFAGAPPAHAGMDPAKALPAPQATLMSTLATGILSGNIDWTMMLVGAATGAALILIDEGLKWRGGVARLPPLAVGLGLYLPSDVSTPISVGAILAWLVDRYLRRRAAEAKVPFETFAEIPRRRGTLIASGLIVGESIFGVILAALIVATDNQSPLALVGASFRPLATGLGAAAFLLVCADIWRRVAVRRPASA
ncbi:MAG TPA: oligopeptide transporter, OPT family [Alphaproteobacteria bacterium]|nr:oligopeptide transporter, OPT family [Alphaproteobacteria bacterium]